MILSKLALKSFIEQSKTSNLEVINGQLIAHKKYKIDVLTYILNKYSDIKQIRFFWESRYSNKDVKIGSILGSNVSIPFHIGSVTLKDNKIVISIDGFQFEDDNFNEYILKCYTDETNQFYQRNDLFGTLRIKSKTGPNIVILNISKFGKKLNFNTTSYLETKNDITHLKIQDCYTSKKRFECNELENLRLNYFNKLREVEKRMNVYSENFELIVDLKTETFKFHSAFCIKKELQRKFLEYICYNYKVLSEPLYSSIIGVAEDFLSEQQQSTVVLSSREIVKDYLDLEEMINF
jgi:hypothetical protein